MGLKVKALLIHLHKRQEELGVKAFYFQNILCNGKVEPAQYPDECQAALDNATTGMVEDHEISIDLKETGVEEVVESPVKQSPAKLNMDAGSPAPTQFTFEAVKDSMTHSINGKQSNSSTFQPGNIQVSTTQPTQYQNLARQQAPGLQHPWPMAPHPMLPPSGLQPVNHSLPPSQGPNSYHAYPFQFTYDPQYMAFWNQQMGDPRFASSHMVAPNPSSCPYSLDPTLNDMDPHLLPAGPPVFAHVLPSD